MMTNETRSPKEIEREIEEQRSDLTSNLEDLQDKFSIDTLVRQIGDQFREHGGDMGRSISSQVKANPIPLALTGIGLAWMMFGNAQKQAAPVRAAEHEGDDRYGEAERGFRRAQRVQGRPYTPPTAHVASRNDGPSWSREDTDNGTSMGDRLSDSAASAKDTAAKGARSVKDVASSAGSKISDVAVSAKSATTSGVKTVQSGIATAGSRIAEGTESLTEKGRQRVIAARQKAVEMRRQTARTMSDGTDAAADFYDRQPLVVGALALAVGAALGGAMPRTRAEDDLMGAHSDRLFDEAERIYEEEKSKAMSVAKSVKDEVKDIAAETKADLDGGAPQDQSAVEAVGDKAKRMANRVADTAKSKAKDEKLGKPRT